MHSFLQQTKDKILILPYIFRILPQVEQELAFWRRQAETIADDRLRLQALASISNKRFHCQGGSVFAGFAADYEGSLIRLIVALQTISDYLDNLCDRVDEGSEEGFRTLHQAMLSAVDISQPCVDWYGHFNLQNDSGYLDKLVHTCRQQLALLPGYNEIRAPMTRLVELYSDLQVYKHLRIPEREKKLISWHRTYFPQFPGLQWWEFAAASGSTLGLFALMSLAADELDPREAERLVEAYFPWICGIHILLDYLIDMDEDRRHGDLNFVTFYPSPQSVSSGLSGILRQAYRHAEKLPRPSFHRTVINGLLALYLSDPKASQANCAIISRRLLHAGGAATKSIHRICLLLRRKGLV